MDRFIQIECLRPGLLTSLQDSGRFHYRHLGVPQGGYLDRPAAQLANTLVGNSTEAPVLEMTILGPQLLFHDSCQIAITGAELSPKLNGVPLNRNQLYKVPANSKLIFGQQLSGCRAYLAIRGSWQVDYRLGSCSPLSIQSKEEERLGLLKKGDVLRIKKDDDVAEQVQLTVEPIDYPKHIDVNLLPGPEFDLFDSISIALCFSHIYQVTADSSRMGLRLKGPSLLQPSKQERISSAVLPGTIQVSHQGQLIILLADAQTTGGYPRLLQIPDAELDRLAQLVPGDKISFKMTPPTFLNET